MPSGCGPSSKVIATACGHRPRGAGFSAASGPLATGGRGSGQLAERPRDLQLARERRDVWSEHVSDHYVCHFRHKSGAPASIHSKFILMSELFDSEVTVRRRRFANDDNGFAVLDADCADGSIVLVGPLIHLENGERAHVTGTVVTDSRYGEQVQVTEARPLPPEDGAALVSYLRRIKNIGEKRAQRLIDRYGAEHVLDAIDEEPAAAFRRVGLNPFRAQEAAASWNELRTIRRLHLLLAPHGLAYLAKRISDEYPNTAHRVITENPYELTRVFGVGFKVADRIARAGAESPDAIPGRVSAAIVYALSEAEGRAGSTCLPVGQLLGAARDLLGEVPDEDAIDQLVADGDLVRDGDWIYRTPTWELEQELTERVLRAPGRRQWRRRRGRQAEAGRRRGLERRRAHPDARAGGGRARRVRAPPVGDHRRSRDRQDGLDPDDREVRGRAAREGAAGRADRARGAADDGGERRRRQDGPLGARLGARASCPSTTRTIRCPATC